MNFATLRHGFFWTLACAAAWTSASLAASPFPTMGGDPVECTGVGWPRDYQPARATLALPSDQLGGRAALIFPENRLAAIDVSALLAEDAARAGIIGRKRLGVNRPVAGDTLGTWQTAPDGGLIWFASIISPDAKMMRLHLVNLHLPAHAHLHYYAPERAGETPDAIFERGPNGDGDYWTNPTAGETVQLELYLPPGAKQELPFRIEEVGHHYVSMDETGVGLRAGLECMQDVRCEPQWSVWQTVAASVAQMTFSDGGFQYLCTGQLLAAQNNDLTPYFLTANHCISTQAVASTLSCRWFFQHTTCNGSLGVSQFSSGATLLAGDPIWPNGRDFTLLMVRGVLPPGVYWSGWTTATINNFENVHSVSHPQGSYKRYAKGTRQVNDVGGYQKISFNWDIGTIDQGSSGSGIWTDGATPATQLLFGDCSFGFGATNCDDPTNPVYYGRFQQYYASISSYLAAGSDDSFDDNDTCATAVDLGSGSYSDLVVKSLDPDWYKFTVGIANPLDITATFTDSQGNIDIQLYDACGGNVVASGTTVTNNESIHYNNVGANHTYYLRVYLSDDTRNEYGLTVSGASVDCNENTLPDECDTDCGLPGCNLPGCGLSPDCNANNNPDDCDIANNISDDCNGNDLPDECETAGGSVADCNANDVPDECDVASGQVPDCNGNDIPDECDIASGLVQDCNDNGIPDNCDIAAGFADDCNANGIPDFCDLGPEGASEDCNTNNIPDECDLTDNDCNANAVPDTCEEQILAGTIVAPTNELACPGDQVVFTTSAPGATAYQWYRGATPLTDGGIISGAATDTLILDPVSSAEDLTSYRCEVSFGCLSAFSASATLDVIAGAGELEVTLLSPSPYTVCAGGGLIVLQVEASDQAGATYQWSKDGVDLNDDGHYSGTQTDTLQITNTTGADNGDYTCRVGNPCISAGQEVSTTGIVELIDPVFTTEPRSTCAETGTNALFHGSATSPLGVVYLWYEGATPLSDGAKFAGTGTATLTVKNVALADNGRQFRLRAVVISPICSTYSPPATLTAMAPGQCPACQFDPGDSDGDGDFDLVDMQRFTACFGADVTAIEECACMNVAAGNTIVDLADWTAMEALIDGPN